MRLSLSLLKYPSCWWFRSYRQMLLSRNINNLCTIELNLLLFRCHLVFVIRDLCMVTNGMPWSQNNPQKNSVPNQINISRFIDKYSINILHFIFEMKKWMNTISKLKEILHQWSISPQSGKYWKRQELHTVQDLWYTVGWDVCWGH